MYSFIWLIVLEKLPSPRHKHFESVLLPKRKVLIVRNRTFGQLKGKFPFFWSKYTIFGAPFSSTVKWKSAPPKKARLQRGVVHCAAENWFQNQCTAYGWELQGESSVPQRWSWRVVFQFLSTTKTCRYIILKRGDCAHATHHLKVGCWFI